MGSKEIYSQSKLEARGMVLESETKDKKSYLKTQQVKIEDVAPEEIDKDFFNLQKAE